MKDISFKGERPKKGKITPFSGVDAFNENNCAYIDQRFDDPLEARRMIEIVLPYTQEELEILLNVAIAKKEEGLSPKPLQGMIDQVMTGTIRLSNDLWDHLNIIYLGCGIQKVAGPYLSKHQEICEKFSILIDESIGGIKND